MEAKRTVFAGKRDSITRLQWKALRYRGEKAFSKIDAYLPVQNSECIIMFLSSQRFTSSIPVNMGLSWRILPRTCLHIAHIGESYAWVEEPSKVNNLYETVSNSLYVNDLLAHPHPQVPFFAPSWLFCLKQRDWPQPCMVCPWAHITADFPPSLGSWDTLTRDRRSRLGKSGYFSLPSLLWWLL